MKMKILSILMISMLALSSAIILFSINVKGDVPSWPSESSWIPINDFEDANESGVSDDYKDVRNSSYYITEDYLFFRLECYGYPDLTAHPDARYKWFIDTSETHDLVGSGNTLTGAEYLLFAEDSPKPHGDGTTDVYLLYDENGVFPTGYDYYDNPGNITNKSVANCNIHGHYVDLYILLENMSNPDKIYFTWATDQGDPNIGSSNGEISESFFNPSISKSDMSIDISDEPDPVIAGDSLTYTLNVTNIGPHDADEVNVTDILPPEVTFLNAVPAPAGNSSSTYWWTYTDFSVGESEIIIITVNVSSSASDHLTNNANVTSSNLDFFPGNDEDIEYTTIADMFSLTINIDGNGSVTKDPDQPTYIYGSEVNLTATADPGWTFNGWSGDLTGSDNPETITIDGNKAVTAHFTQDQYTLNITIVGSGSISKNPDQINYTYGTNVELTASSGSRWKFSYWSGDLTGTNITEIINMTGNKFITAYFKQSGGGGGGGGIPTQDDTTVYYDPTAITDGPYSAFVGEEIQLDATASHDNDENGSSIDRFDWKFSDDDYWHNNSGATPIYTYNLPGTYNISLRVFDNEGSSDINTTFAIIIRANNPPGSPEITGPENGIRNVSYNFSVVATDEDGDNLKYTIDWGDGNTTESDFLASEIPFNTSHAWEKSGNYTIQITADDNSTLTVEEVTIEILEPEKVGETNIILPFLLLLLLILIIFLLLWKRRRDKEESEKGSKAPAGTKQTH